MPKRLRAGREELLKSARSLLLTGGYDALTVRTLAATCGVSVGTVYNFFPSKDHLVASVMLEDWQLTLVRMEREAECAGDALSGLSGIFDALTDFYGSYEKSWAQYRMGPESSVAFRQRHKQLLEQLGRVTAPLLLRFQCAFFPELPEFLGQTLLTAAPEGRAGFRKLLPILKKLIEP